MGSALAGHRPAAVDDRASLEEHAVLGAGEGHLDRRTELAPLHDLVGDDHINDAVVELVRRSIGLGEYSYAAELIEALRDLLP